MGEFQALRNLIFLLEENETPNMSQTQSSPPNITTNSTVPPSLKTNSQTGNQIPMSGHFLPLWLVKYRQSHY